MVLNDCSDESCVHFVSADKHLTLTLCGTLESTAYIKTLIRFVA